MEITGTEEKSYIYIYIYKTESWWKMNRLID